MSYLPTGITARDYISRFQETAPAPVTAELEPGKTQKCPSGQTFSERYTKCVPACPRNESWNEQYSKCVPVHNPVCLPTETLSEPMDYVLERDGRKVTKAIQVQICRPSREGISPTCPEGYTFGPRGECIPISSAVQNCKPGEDRIPCAERLCRSAVDERLMPQSLYGSCVWWKQGIGSDKRIVEFLKLKQAEIDAWKQEEAAKQGAEFQAGAAAAKSPAWLMPAVLGGAALVAVLALRKK